MRSDIVPGGVFPDFALPDHTDTVRSLSEVQGRDPMILTLDWSPFHGWDRRAAAKQAESAAGSEVAT